MAGRLACSLVAAQGKTNFFEKRVGEDQKSGVMSNLHDKENATNKFSMDEDF